MWLTKCISDLFYLLTAIVCFGCWFPVKCCYFVFDKVFLYPLRLLVKIMGGCLSRPGRKFDKEKEAQPKALKPKSCPSSKEPGKKRNKQDSPKHPTSSGSHLVEDVSIDDMTRIYTENMGNILRKKKQREQQQSNVVSKVSTTAAPVVSSAPKPVPSTVSPAPVILNSNTNLKSSPIKNRNVNTTTLSSGLKASLPATKSHSANNANKNISTNFSMYESNDIPASKLLPVKIIDNSEEQVSPRECIVNVEDLPQKSHPSFYCTSGVHDSFSIMHEKTTEPRSLVEITKSFSDQIISNQTGAPKKPQRTVEKTEPTATDMSGVSDIERYRMTTTLSNDRQLCEPVKTSFQINEINDNYPRKNPGTLGDSLKLLRFLPTIQATQNLPNVHVAHSTSVSISPNICEAVESPGNQKRDAVTNCLSNKKAMELPVNSVVPTASQASITEILQEIQHSTKRSRISEGKPQQQNLGVWNQTETESAYSLPYSQTNDVKPLTDTTEDSRISPENRIKENDKKVLIKVKISNTKQQEKPVIKSFSGYDTEMYNKEDSTVKRVTDSESSQPILNKASEENGPKYPQQMIYSASSSYSNEYSEKYSTEIQNTSNNEVKETKTITTLEKRSENKYPQQTTSSDRLLYSNMTNEKHTTEIQNIPNNEVKGNENTTTLKKVTHEISSGSLSYSNDNNKNYLTEFHNTPNNKNLTEVQNTPNNEVKENDNITMFSNYAQQTISSGGSLYSNENDEKYMAEVQNTYNNEEKENDNKTKLEKISEKSSYKYSQQIMPSARLLYSNENTEKYMTEVQNTPNIECLAEDQNTSNTEVKENENIKKNSYKYIALNKKDEKHMKEVQNISNNEAKENEDITTLRKVREEMMPSASSMYSNEKIENHLTEFQIVPNVEYFTEVQNTPNNKNLIEVQNTPNNEVKENENITNFKRTIDGNSYDTPLKGSQKEDTYKPYSELTDKEESFEIRLKQYDENHNGISSVSRTSGKQFNEFVSGMLNIGGDDYYDYGHAYQSWQYSHDSSSQSNATKIIRIEENRISEMQVPDSKSDNEEILYGRSGDDNDSDVLQIPGNQPPIRDNTKEDMRLSSASLFEGSYQSEVLMTQNTKEVKTQPDNETNFQSTQTKVIGEQQTIDELLAYNDELEAIILEAQQPKIQEVDVFEPPRGQEYITPKRNLEIAPQKGPDLHQPIKVYDQVYDLGNQEHIRPELDLEIAPRVEPEPHHQIEDNERHLRHQIPHDSGNQGHIRPELELEIAPQVESEPHHQIEDNERHLRNQIPQQVYDPGNQAHIRPELDLETASQVEPEPHHRIEDNDRHWRYQIPQQVYDPGNQERIRPELDLVIAPQVEPEPQLFIDAGNGIQIPQQLYNTVIRSLHEIQSQAEPFEEEIRNFTELEGSDQHFYIEESLRRLIDKLDDLLDDIGNVESLRVERKRVYRFIFPMFERLDEKVIENRQRMEREDRRW